MIDIIIPTMWKDTKFIKYLETYANSKYINKIFIIDNFYQNRPKNIIVNEKIVIINYGKNIYVNPAWNEGYYRSKAPIICLLNDDIEVDNSLFEDISKLDFSEIDIIGVHLKGSVDNFHIIEHPDRKEELIKMNINKHHPIGGQSYAFGVCMFIKRSSYKPIPSLYQIWFGDDYLIQNCENIYALKTSKIKGEISKTIVDCKQNIDIQKRIDLDSKNAYNYNHFLNVKNWDIVRHTVQTSINKNNSIGNK